MVINRHGDFDAPEIYHILNFLFITRQVGAENDRELGELLCGKIELLFPEQYLSITFQKFRNAGFKILDAQEYFPSIKFFDVGALVWFARIIQREFPNFSVDTCMDGLRNAQKLLEQKGYIEGRTRRFLLVTQK